MERAVGGGLWGSAPARHELFAPLLARHVPHRQRNQSGGAARVSIARIETHNLKRREHAHAAARRRPQPNVDVAHLERVAVGERRARVAVIIEVEFTREDWRRRLGENRMARRLLLLPLVRLLLGDGVVEGVARLFKLARELGEIGGLDEGRACGERCGERGSQLWKGGESAVERGGVSCGKEGSQLWRGEVGCGRGCGRPRTLIKHRAADELLLAQQMIAERAHERRRDCPDRTEPRELERERRATRLADGAPQRLRPTVCTRHVEGEQRASKGVDGRRRPRKEGGEIAPAQARRSAPWRPSTP